MSQWRYVVSSENPADIASRGLGAESLSNDSPWFVGPSFLWSDQLPLPCKEEAETFADDPEVKQVRNLATGTQELNYANLLDRLCYFPDWNRAKRAVALCLRFRNKLLKKGISTFKADYQGKSAFSECQSSFVSELQEAELEILRHVQESYFKDEVVTQNHGILYSLKDRHGIKKL